VNPPIRGKRVRVTMGKEKKNSDRKKRGMGNKGYKNVVSAYVVSREQEKIRGTRADGGWGGKWGTGKGKWDTLGVAKQKQNSPG